MTAGTRFYEDLREAASKAKTIHTTGTVTEIVGLVIEATGPKAPVGEVVRIRTRAAREGATDRVAPPPAYGDVLPGEVLGEVVGFRAGRTLVMPIGEMAGVAPGDPVVGTGKPFLVGVGESLLGRVLDGLGTPIDDGPPPEVEAFLPVLRRPPDPVRRPRITEVLPLGVRAIDGVLTVGRGQRIGIFSGSGVGKSTLLGMMARYTKADVSVVALVGERGREVREFLERDLGPEGRRRSVCVVATGDAPPLVRIRALYTATTIAEYFRDRGADVLLLCDSVTRFARSQREVGLAVGEPPATRGFPPSVFTLLPRILERAGRSERGSITGLYTILVDADDMNEPIADTVRGILDGHIVLSRALADRAHYPAIDPLPSVSRVMPDIVSREQMEAARKLKELLAVYRDAEDLIRIGAYVEGTDPKIDEARKKIDAVNAFLRQRVDEPSDFAETVEALRKAVA